MAEIAIQNHIMLKYFLLLFLSTTAFSQTINFNVKDEEGIAIPFCNVLLIEKSTNATLEFTKIINGIGVYSVKKKYTSLIINVQSVNYFYEKVVIENPDQDKTYNFSIVMKNNHMKQLDEVIIKTPDRPYSVKKDTVIFDVAKYRDGNEKKVEDLLKKLPGIEVDVNGGIKYRGKVLETVTLDGDNIFNSNYKLGTKNINIDMVEQIEAIENYTNNILLKGIESDGKVALNLKLKKGKSDYSGNLENGLGLKNELNGAYYSNSYLMQIAARVKSFTTLNLNNIGRSDSFFYEKQNSKSLDKKSEEDFKTIKLLSDQLFAPSLDPVRFNRNNQFFISHNNLYKFNKKVSLKTNLNFIDDRIDSEQRVMTQNFFNNTTVETNDNFIFKKKPKVFTAELELRINTSKSSLLEIFSKQYFESTKLFSDYTKNNSLAYNNINISENYLGINKVVHTWKIASNKALQGNAYYAINIIPQQFSSVNANESLIQDSKFKKSTILINYNLVGKSKFLSYTIQMGSNNIKTPYLSQNSIVGNNTLFINNTIYNHSRVRINSGRITFVPGISFTNYYLSLSSSGLNIISPVNTVIIEPSISAEYKMKGSLFTALYSNTRKPIKEENIFIDRVFVSNRSTILNKPSFDFQKRNAYSLSYFYTDLSSNATLNMSIQYDKNNGNYLSDFTIDENTVVVKNVFYEVYNTLLSANLRFSRFFEKLKTTATSTSSITATEYLNIVNSSDIRKNNNQIINNSLKIGTGFASRINFQNTFSHSSIASKSGVTNRVESIQNSFSMRTRISKKSSATLKSDFFIPNLSNSSNSYHFVDLECGYKFNDNINLTLLANNLLDLKSFNQVENNDFSAYISQTNLTKRFFLINVEFTF